MPTEEQQEMDEVTREVTLGAVREEVWAALTDPERLQEWLGDALVVDLRPGGELVLRLPDGEERHGFVEEVDPPSTLVLWWRPVGEDGEEGELTRVEFRLEPASDGTRLRVLETRPMAVLDARGIELPAAPRRIDGPASLALVS
jgi:uncharacterized protein YndB with AHSA1/START domain